MNKGKRNVVIGFIILLLISIIYGIIQNKKIDKALLKSDLVIAAVNEIFVNRGVFVIRVKYTYKDKIFNNEFGTYNVDSIKRGTKIRLLVSKDTSQKYIKYIGVLN